MLVSLNHFFPQASEGLMSAVKVQTVTFEQKLI